MQNAKAYTMEVVISSEIKRKRPEILIYSRLQTRQKYPFPYNKLKNKTKLMSNSQCSSDSLPLEESMVNAAEISVAGAEEVDLRSYRKWTLEDNLRYVRFLEENIDNFKSQKDRREHKVFKVLSSVMGNKTQAQCKSHHQKMMKGHKNLQKIIKSILGKAKKVNLTPETSVKKIQSDSEVTHQDLPFREIPTYNSLPEIEVREKELWEVMDAVCWGYKTEI